MYNTVSATDTATNKSINFRVVYVKVWNYQNKTTHYVSLHALYILRAQIQCNNIKTTLKPNGKCETYIDIRMFWQKLLRAETSTIFVIFSQEFLPQVYKTFMRGITNLPGRQKTLIHLIHGMNLEISKTFFVRFPYCKILTLRYL